MIIRMAKMCFWNVYLTPDQCSRRMICMGWMYYKIRLICSAQKVPSFRIDFLGTRTAEVKCRMMMVMMMMMARPGHTKL